ncbi:MAG: long-chain fatty acid transport protein [Ignavibacteria bacterium]|nr:MAG: long-chain fatty acid transport protein [Ignavibacteria bacterium]KAF0160526.1 MAG: long-chain fatty acid transport protein [Ignavibacteria bacterium]
MKVSLKLLLVFMMTSTLFAQSGTRLVGFDAKSIGRGGTSIGVFDGGELMMTNPAGLSFVNQSMLNVDFSMMFPALHFQNKLNNVDGDNNIFPLPSASYLRSCDCSDFTWGIGFFTAGGMGADYKLNHALFGTTKQEYHSKLALMQGGFSAAYKFNEHFSVGASLHMVYSMLEFSMPYSLNPLSMQGVANPMIGMTFGQMFAGTPPNGFGYDEVTAAAKMSDLTALGFNGKIGLAYKVDNKLSFGLSYTLPTSLTYTGGKATMDMTAQLNDAFGKAVMGWMMQNPGKTQAQAQAAIMTQFAQLGIDMSKGVVANYDLDVDLTFPASFGYGVSYKATDCLMLAADVEYLMWENAFDKMTLKMKGGNNANINKMMGGAAFNIDFPMNWKNSLMLKVGGEYLATKDLTVRLGYTFNSNPVPEATIFPIFPAIVENHIMAGLSYKVSAPLTINAAFEMALNNSLKASNPSLIANEYDGSTSALSTKLIHISCSYAF